MNTSGLFHEHSKNQIHFLINPIYTEGFPCLIQQSWDGSLYILRDDRLEFTNYDAFQSLVTVLILAKSVNPGEFLHSALKIQRPM